MTNSPHNPATPTPHSQTNRLAREVSPYLLQHQFNPVDWYPWGEEAFDRARQEDKPILLSIGYSTCHWCHVMERESFENTDIAAFLNAHFVAIKVDREERPDVDKIYMTFVQATTRQGGWPLNVFLTPELKPFYGGTYFPPEPRHGRPSFLQLLQQVHQLWSTKRGDINQSASELHQRLSAFSQSSQPSDSALSPDLLSLATQQFKTGFDARHAGFGGAPKFPRPSLPAFLLRFAVRQDDKEAQDMVLKTCQRMAAGGMNDQLGGGFHRYAVDAEWLVPHFEKMLYDNAQLVDLYLDAFLVTQDTPYARTAEAILDYILRDMTHAEGGFFSAEDADSEGHEGKFYCWTLAELSSLLTEEELRLVTRRFGLTAQGNFADHSHPEPLAAQNILSLVDPDLSAAEVPLLESALEKMRTTRKKRIRPHLDDKVLTSWNGLMLGAFARASVILQSPRYQQAAERNFKFIRTHLWDAPSQTLHHRWREGERDDVQLVDAYACLLDGVIDLYEATLQPEALTLATELADAMLERFYDAEAGGFYQSATTDHLILRMKEDYDGAEPSGNSVATLALLRLGAITGRAAYRQAAETTLRFFADRLRQQPEALPYLLQALDAYLHEPHRVVLTGDRSSPAAQQLLQAAHAVYQPNKVILGQTGAVEPFAQSLPAEAEPLAYVCTGDACLPATREPQVLQAALR